VTCVLQEGSEEDESVDSEQPSLDAQSMDSRSGASTVVHDGKLHKYTTTAVTTTTTTATSVLMMVSTCCDAVSHALISINVVVRQVGLNLIITFILLNQYSSSSVSRDHTGWPS